MCIRDSWHSAWEINNVNQDDLETEETEEEPTETDYEALISWL